MIPTMARLTSLEERALIGDGDDARGKLSQTIVAEDTRTTDEPGGNTAILRRILEAMCVIDE